MRNKKNGKKHENKGMCSWNELMVYTGIIMILAAIILPFILPPSVTITIKIVIIGSLSLIAILFIFSTIRQEYESNQFRKQEGLDIEFPCPCCGFITLSSTGDFEICEICGWEDDPVHQKYPCYQGGKDRKSLKEAQNQLLLKLPHDIAEYGSYLRAPKWRPLKKEECIEPPNSKTKGELYSEQLESESRFYWEARPDHWDRK